MLIKLNGDVRAEVELHDIDSFPYDKLANKQDFVCKGATRYYQIFGTFDIETTNMIKGDRWKENWAFMYVWQACIDGLVVAGRTWEEYSTFLERVRDVLPQWKLVIYVHNLQFEFQFMRNFYNFTKVFARKKRQVVKCCDDWIEYRCSYILTNMSLDKFLKKTKGVTWRKQSGKDFNYGIIRYPDTQLTVEEWLYCVCDVLGLWEAINNKLNSDGFNVASVPLTSTGFVRLDYRQKCIQNKQHMNRFVRGRLNGEQYLLLRQSSRGGIAGSNNVNTGWTIKEVNGEDIKSSYPYQMATKYFPTGRFGFVDVKPFSDKFNEYCHTMCCIIVWSAENIKLKNWATIPYIARAKCTAVIHGHSGNGKLYSAEQIGMCCTEIDFRIICEQYEFENMKIHKMMVADRGKLSKAFREHLLEMFQIKTDLEDGDPYDYMKFKNKINASFGMLLTDILYPEVLYNGTRSKEVFTSVEVDDIEVGLDKYYKSKNSFLNYQDGVWVLAHGRDDLVTGMKVVGEDIIQCDTDSVKHIGNYHDEFNALNSQIMELAESYDIKPYSVNKKGEKVYLGIWEHERLKDSPDDVYCTYKAFRTLGAKKYAYMHWDGTIEGVISGVPKEEGAEWFKRNGLDGMRPSATIPAGECGRLIAYYNDLSMPMMRVVDGHEIYYGSNICLVDGSYTFGVTDEWEEMIYGDWDWQVDDDNAGVEA